MSITKENVNDSKIRAALAAGHLSTPEAIKFQKRLDEAHERFPRELYALVDITETYSDIDKLIESSKKGLRVIEPVKVKVLGDVSKQNYDGLVQAETSKVRDIWFESKKVIDTSDSPIINEMIALMSHKTSNGLTTEDIAENIARRIIGESLPCSMLETVVAAKTQQIMGLWKDHTRLKNENLSPVVKDLVKIMVDEQTGEPINPGQAATILGKKLAEEKMPVSLRERLARVADKAMEAYQNKTLSQQILSKISKMLFYAEYRSSKDDAEKILDNAEKLLAQIKTTTSEAIVAASAVLLVPAEPATVIPSGIFTEAVRGSLERAEAQEVVGEAPTPEVEVPRAPAIEVQAPVEAARKFVPQVEQTPETKTPAATVESSVEIPTPSVAASLQEPAQAVAPGQPGVISQKPIEVDKVSKVEENLPAHMADTLKQLDARFDALPVDLRAELRAQKVTSEKSEFTISVTLKKLLDADFEQAKDLSGLPDIFSQIDSKLKTYERTAKMREQGFTEDNVLTLVEDLIAHDTYLSSIKEQFNIPVDKRVFNIPVPIYINALKLLDNAHKAYDNDEYKDARRIESELRVKVAALKSALAQPVQAPSVAAALQTPPAQSASATAEPTSAPPVTLQGLGAVGASTSVKITDERTTSTDALATEPKTQAAKEIDVPEELLEVEVPQAQPAPVESFKERHDRLNAVIIACRDLRLIRLVKSSRLQATLKQASDFQSSGQTREAELILDQVEKSLTPEQLAVLSTKKETVSEAVRRLRDEVDNASYLTNVKRGSLNHKLNNAISSLDISVAREEIVEVENELAQAKEKAEAKSVAPVAGPAPKPKGVPAVTAAPAPGARSATPVATPIVDPPASGAASKGSTPQIIPRAERIEPVKVSRIKKFFRTKITRIKEFTKNGLILIRSRKTKSKTAKVAPTLTTKVAPTTAATAPITQTVSPLPFTAKEPTVKRLKNVKQLKTFAKAAAIVIGVSLVGLGGVRTYHTLKSRFSSPFASPPKVVAKKEVQQRMYGPPAYLKPREVVKNNDKKTIKKIANVKAKAQESTKKETVSSSVKPRPITTITIGGKRMTVTGVTSKASFE